MSDLVRNAVKLALCLLIAGALLLTNFFVFLSNWTGLAAGFELLGYEMRPLHSMPIVGPLLEGLFGDATYAFFAAGAMALVLFLGYYLAAHKLIGMVQGLRDGAIGRIQGRDPVAQKALGVLMLVDLIQLALLAAVLTPISYLELAVWRLRTIQGAEQIPVEQIASVVPWASIGQYPDTWVRELAGLGGWGYLCVAAAGALMLELSFLATGEAWSRVTANASTLWTTLAGSPASVRRAPVQVARQAASRRAEPALATTVADAPVPAPAATTPSPPAAAIEPSVPRREVIGEGTMVTLEEARANSKYYVDEDGIIWLKSYRTALFGT